MVSRSLMAGRCRPPASPQPLAHPAADLTDADFISVQTKMRHRGLRWLHRHGHLDSAAVHTLDAPGPDSDKPTEPR